METSSAESARKANPESWVDLYGDDLFRTAMLRLQDKTAAEDVVQETFLAAIKSASAFRGDSSVKTWLQGILKFKIVDHLRRKYREKKIDTEVMEDEEIDRYFQKNGKWNREHAPARWGLNPDRDFENKELLHALKRCLQALPKRLGDAFSLRTIDDLSSEEVCKVLGITTTNLWVMLYRARMRMRKCLETTWFHNLGI